MKTACFTGHRHFSGDLSALKADMYDKLERAIINGGIVDYFAGGAIGFDTLAAETVILLRKKYPPITLNLVLPCCDEEQSASWNDDAKHTYYRIMEQADTVEFVSQKYYNGCMKARNARLVELADFCYCYYDPKQYRSGTAQTVRLAQNKNIPIWNFFKA